MISFTKSFTNHKNKQPMKNTKHTSGKWHIVTHSDGWSIQNKENGSGEMICQQYGNSSEANAKLIAAAPDLLEALQKAERRLNPDVKLREDEESVFELHELVKAAIKKATE